MTFYLFRHGLATYSKHGYGKDVFSAHILPEAKEPTRKMGEYLKAIPTDQKFTSEFTRCLETAAIITQITGKEFVKDPRLNEFQPSFDPNPFLQEKFDSFKQRLTSFYNEVSQKGNNTILICTHGSVIGGLKQVIQGGNLEEEDLHWFPKTGVLVKITKDTIEEIDFNK